MAPAGEHAARGQRVDASQHVGLRGLAGSARRTSTTTRAGLRNLKLSITASIAASISRSLTAGPSGVSVLAGRLRGPVAASISRSLAAGPSGVSVLAGSLLGPVVAGRLLGLVVVGRVASLVFAGRLPGFARDVTATDYRMAAVASGRSPVAWSTGRVSGLPDRRALRCERARRLAEVFRWKERGVPHRDALEPLGDVATRGLIEHLLHASHHERRIGRDLCRKRACRGVDGGAISDDLADQPEREGAARVDVLAGQRELARGRIADDQRQPLQAAEVGDDRDLGLAHREARVRGADPEIARRDEVDATADASAVDRRNRGDRAARDRRDRRLDLADHLP
jgi:hypothetical protein